MCEYRDNSSRPNELAVGLVDSLRTAESGRSEGMIVFLRSVVLQLGPIGLT